MLVQFVKSIIDLGLGHLQDLILLYHLRRTSHRNIKSESTVLKKQCTWKACLCVSGYLQIGHSNAEKFGSIFENRVVHVQLSTTDPKCRGYESWKFYVYCTRLCSSSTCSHKN